MNNKAVPPLGTLYFYMSSYCNCACRHCWISPEYLDARSAPDEAPYATFKDIIDQAIPLGLKNIKFTGGEPLLSNHTRSLMTYAYEKKLGITVETNGVLLDEAMADFLRSVNLAHIAISLDGPDAATHEELRGVEGVFERTVNAIRLCAQRGFSTQAIMSIYRKNCDLIDATARYAQSLGARSIKLNCISHIERASHLEEENAILSIPEYLRIKEKIDKEIQPSLKIRIILDIPPVYNFFPQRSRHHGRCGILNILGVLADGSISICGIGASTPELLFGSLNERSLADIWHNEPFLIQLREGLPHKLEGICGECMLKGFCLGKCRAEAYYSNHNIFAPFSFCKEADRLGLYPERFRYNNRSVKKVV